MSSQPTSIPPSRRGSAASDPLRVVFRQLLGVAHRSGREVTELFTSMFEEGEGKISHEELREALLSPELGVAMQPSQIDQLIWFCFCFAI